MDHYNEAALPVLGHSATDVANSTRKVRRIVEGHDPEEWPKFKKAPDFYA